MDEMVARLVQEAMDAAGMNMERLAEEAGIPRVTLRRRLKEGASFSIAELDRVADALDIDLIDLIPRRKTGRRVKASA